MPNILTVVWKTKFKKDYKIAKKRGKNLRNLLRIITHLEHGRSLAPKNKNHKLKGEYADCWECHIEPDWLLIYQCTTHQLLLLRTGSHSDLF